MEGWKGGVSSVQSSSVQCVWRRRQTPLNDESNNGHDVPKTGRSVAPRHPGNTERRKEKKKHALYFLNRLIPPRHPLRNPPIPNVRILLRHPIIPTRHAPIHAIIPMSTPIQPRPRRLRRCPQQRHIPTIQHLVLLRLLVPIMIIHIIRRVKLRGLRLRVSVVCVWVSGVFGMERLLLVWWGYIGRGRFAGTEGR